MKFKVICKKISNFLRPVFGWGIYIALFAGGLTFFGFVVALIIGGDTGNAISLFISKQVFPWIIRLSTTMVVLGLIIMYLNGEVALTSGKKKAKKK